MKVRALKQGTWPANRLRERGEVFEYDGPTSKEVGGKKAAYLPSWMEKVKPAKPEPDDEATKAAGNKTGE